MAFINKDGLQHLTNKLVKAENIKVASLRGSNIKEVIDNIQRECDNVAQPNTMIIENNVSEFKIGKGRNIDVSGDVEEGRVEVELKGRTFQNLCSSSISLKSSSLSSYNVEDLVDRIKITKITESTPSWSYLSNYKIKLNMLKPDTNYTLFFRYKASKAKQLQVYIAKGNGLDSLCPISNAINLYGDVYKVDLRTFSSFENKEIGEQVIYFSNLNLVEKYSWLEFYKDMILLEGNHSNITVEELPEFFESIKSSFEDGIVAVEVIEHDNPNNKKKISFNIGEPLKSLPNGISDEIVNNNGEWQLIRRIGKKILNGTETSWNKHSYSNNNFSFFCIVEDTAQENSSAVLCNEFSQLEKTAEQLIYENIEGIWKGWNSGRSFFFWIKNSRLQSSDINGFKLWLQQHPVVVYYELLNPIITPIKPLLIEASQGTTIKINSEIAPYSTHTVILNRSGQIEQGIELIAKLRNKIDNLEREYDNNLLNTQLQINNLKLNLKLKGDK